MAQALLLAASVLFCLALGGQQSALQTMRPGQTYIGCLPGATECTPKAGHPCMTVNISSSEWRGGLHWVFSVPNAPTSTDPYSFLGKLLLGSGLTPCGQAQNCNVGSPLPPNPRQALTHQTPLPSQSWG
ncbi:unnamed protein product [Caretta caretta]